MAQASLSTSNVLLIEMPPPFIALRGMAAMVCGLRYGEHNRLAPLENVAA
jgi:hypothetical protein